MSSSSPFDLCALLEKFDQLQIKQQDVKEEEEEKGGHRLSYGPQIAELYGVRLCSPFQVLPHQIQAVKWILDREDHPLLGVRGGLLVAEMGLGKTLLSLLLICCDRLRQAAAPQTQKPGPTLIVVPKSILQNWANECMKFFGPGLKVLIYFREFMSDKNEFHRLGRDDIQKYHIVLTTYETIARQSHVPAKPVGPGMLKLPWYRVICDESHRVRNLKNKQFLALMNVPSKRKLALTGTPICNYAKDMYTQLRLLNFNEVKNHKDWSEKLYHQLKLSRLVFCLTAEQAGLNLPPLHRHPILFKLEGVEKQIYESFSREAQRALEDVKHAKPKGMSRILQVMIRWRQTCVSCHLLPKEVLAPFQSCLPRFSAKLRRVEQLLQKEIPKGEKVILFSNWTSVLLQLKEMLPVNQTELVEGSMSSQARTEALDRFLEKGPKGATYLLITFGVGNVGLNLTIARFMILMDPWYSPAVWDQARKRSHRIGQTKPVHVFEPLVEDSVETRIIEICHQKISLADRFLRLQGKDTKDCNEETVEDSEEQEEAMMMKVLHSLFPKKEKRSTSAFQKEVSTRPINPFILE